MMFHPKFRSQKAKFLTRPKTEQDGSVGFVATCRHNQACHFQIGRYTASAIHCTTSDIISIEMTA
jgi:hypothetical protein